MDQSDRKIPDESSRWQKHARSRWLNHKQRRVDKDWGPIPKDRLRLITQIETSRPISPNSAISTPAFLITPNPRSSPLSSHSLSLSLCSATIQGGTCLTVQFALFGRDPSKICRRTLYIKSSCVCCQVISPRYSTFSQWFI